MNWGSRGTVCGIYWLKTREFQRIGAIFVRARRRFCKRLGKQYRLGVISNADGQIASVLKHCGIADCFQTITDSGLFGCEKPRAEIFQAALREMDVRPEESLYVGDVYSVDYLGATRAGLQAILFDVAGAYSNNGLKRVESLEELERILTA